MKTDINRNFLKGKTILVTGGTGSLGQNLVGNLFNMDLCKKIIIFSRDEFKQHQMKQKFSDPEDKLRFFLGDVRDLARLQRAFRGVDIVIHAAALKQVPALEYNPLEAVKTNVLGTQNVIDAALDEGVKKVLLISTDKAVNPINLYGGTKLCAEKLWIAANAYRPTKESMAFSVVRYGNVIGSRGSLVELLQEQKKKGEITLTHGDMTRFWITIDQAVELVLNSLRLMRGGEIFVPKLSAMKIKDLISAIAPDCKVKVIGIRPGEKLHEVLLSDDEVGRTRNLKNYYVIEPNRDAVDPRQDWWIGDHIKEFKYIPTNFHYSSHKVKILTKEDFLNFIK